jgi:molybdopterin converting factor small subunit
MIFFVCVFRGLFRRLYEAFSLLLAAHPSLYGTSNPMGIRVKVYAPGFINHDSIDPNGYVDLEEGDSIGQLYQKLKLPLALRFIMICSVNYGQARLSTRLKDGDIVTFLFPISGG